MNQNFWWIFMPFLFLGMMGIGIVCGGILFLRQSRLLAQGSRRSQAVIKVFSWGIIAFGAIILLCVGGCFGYSWWIHYVPPVDFESTGIWIPQREGLQDGFVVNGIVYKDSSDLPFEEEDAYTLNLWRVRQMPLEAVYSERIGGITTSFFVPSHWETHYRVMHEGDFEMIWSSISFNWNYRQDEEEAVLAYFKSAPKRYYWSDKSNFLASQINPQTSEKEMQAIELPSELTDALGGLLDGSARGKKIGTNYSTLSEIRYLTEAPMDGLLYAEPVIIARYKGKLVFLPQDTIIPGDKKKCLVYEIPETLAASLEALLGD